MTNKGNSTSSLKQRMNTLLLVLTTVLVCSVGAIVRGMYTATTKQQPVEVNDDGLNTNMVYIGCEVKYYNEDYMIVAETRSGRMWTITDVPHSIEALAPKRIIIGVDTRGTADNEDDRAVLVYGEYEGATGVPAADDAMVQKEKENQ